MSKKLNINDWVFRGDYEQRLLSASFWLFWHRTNIMKKITSFEPKSSQYYLNGKYYWHKDDVFLKQFALVEKELKAGEYNRIKEFFSLLEKENNQWIKFTKTTPSEVTLENTKKFFDKYIEMLSFWSIIFAYIIPIENRVISELEREGKTLGEVSNIFKFNRKTDMEKLIDICKKIDFNDENLITEILEEYSWFGTHHWEGEGFDIEKLKEFCENINLTKEDIQETNTKLNEDLIDVYSNCIYWRTHIAETVDKGVFLYRNYLIKLGKKFDLTYNDLMNMTFFDVLKLFDGEKPKINRSKVFGIFYSYDEEFILLDEAEVKDYTTQLTPKKDSQELKEFKGQIASKGYFKGNVRIVKSPDDFGKFQKGEILVVYETTPNFVPLMSKAGAIVAQTGGLTSHAAIVSRELGVACIVGVKDIVSNLKDGDIVEVDANLGVVKLIN